MATPDSQTEYWKSIPNRIADLHRRIVASDGGDEHELRGETVDLMQTLSNRLELAIRRTTAGRSLDGGEPAIVPSGDEIEAPLAAKIAAPIAMIGAVVGFVTAARTS